MILWLKSAVESENLDYYKNDCYETTEENLLITSPFSGEFLGWLSFKDLFQASVINVDGLGNSETLQLLKLHVCGEAAELVKTIQTKDTNFELARNTLEDYYTNVQQLVYIYISNLLDLPGVTSEPASQLNTLLSET